MYRLSIPPEEDFHISQVYPLSEDDDIDHDDMSNGIICLANKYIPLPEGLDGFQITPDVRAEDPGVDYFLSK